MDRARMKKVAKAMNRLQEHWTDRADENAALVIEGFLTPDEAAQCLAEADLDMREVLTAEGYAPGPGGHMGVARQAIDSRLPNYGGLIPGRHL